MIIAGTALLAAGPLVVSFFGADSSYAVLVPGLVLTGIGAGFFYPSITTAAVTMLDASRSSLAGGITYMFQIAGGAIGLGLTTALFTSRSEDLVVSEAADNGLQMTGDQAGVIHGYLAGTEPGDAGLRAVRHLGRRQGPRRGQGLVRRRDPAQPAGGRRDRPGRAGDRDPRRAPPATAPAKPSPRLTPDPRA